MKTGVMNEKPIFIQLAGQVNIKLYLRKLEGTCLYKWNVIAWTKGLIDNKEIKS